MMGNIADYDRKAAVEYAHKWAYGRNPQFYNYDTIGGDCTNFASQCIFAGSGVMNYTQTFGWYYINANRKAPAWSGVEYLFNFITRSKNSVGPKGFECKPSELLPGDIVQLSFTDSGFQHSPVVVEVAEPFSLDNILIAAHTYDTDYKPVSTYIFERIRFIHIENVLRN